MAPPAPAVERSFLRDSSSSGEDSSFGAVARAVSGEDSRTQPEPNRDFVATTTTTTEHDGFRHGHLYHHRHHHKTSLSDKRKAIIMMTSSAIAPPYAPQTPSDKSNDNDINNGSEHHLREVDEKRISVAGSTHHAEVLEIDEFRVLGLSKEDADFYRNYPDEKRRKIIQKVDWRLVPMLALLYLMCHIDRGNIGNAKIEGMIKDLNMTDGQYNMVLSIFFVPYIIFEIPSNIILERLERPSRYIGILVICWGIVMTCTGFVQDLGGLVATRVLLGFFEAGFFPAAIYLSSCWYMPKRLALRLSLFYSASALSGAFSGLLAAAIAQMNGVGGYQGWRWIFILEGIATVLVGISCFWLLIDTPRLSTRWLEPDEIRYLELSIFIKQGGNFREAGGVHYRDLIIVMKNWRIYVKAFFSICQAAVFYGFKFTMPTIMKGMGFTTTNAQLVSAPPYVAGAISAICVAQLSDRFYWRMPFLAVPALFVAVAYSIILSLNGDVVNQRGVAYFAVVLATIAYFPMQPIANSWNANNIAPASRRAVGIALQNCLGNLGGIIGSYMYIEHEAPRYPTGYGISLAMGLAAFVGAILMDWYYKLANERKDRAAEDAKVRYTEEELFEMGEKSPLFRYVL